MNVEKFLSYNGIDYVSQSDKWSTTIITDKVTIVETTDVAPVKFGDCLVTRNFINGHEVQESELIDRLIQLHNLPA